MLHESNGIGIFILVVICACRNNSASCYFYAPALKNIAQILMRAKQISFVFVCLSLNNYAQHPTSFRSLLSRQSGFHDIMFPASVNIWKCIDPLQLIWDYFNSLKNEWKRNVVSRLHLKYTVLWFSSRKPIARTVDRVMCFYYTFAENTGPASHCAHNDAEKECNASSLSTTHGIVSEIRSRFV